MSQPTKISFLNREFETPLVGSAGCVGYGWDFQRINSHNYGGWIFKSISLEPLAGNLSPRVCETPHGFINSIGLQNPGFDVFTSEYYPLFSSFSGVKIASLAAFGVDDFISLVEKFNSLEDIDFLELNLSCPNIAGKTIFATDKNLLRDIVRKTVKTSKKPVIYKLSPNVTSIADMAEIVEGEGGKAVTISNTFWGMKIDIHTREPMIHNKVGGYSGPAIKPIITALVYQAAQRVKIPIIAIGGVMNGEDVIEYLLAGASLVGIGTANFLNPKVSINIQRGLVKYTKKNRVELKNLIGAMK